MSKTGVELQGIGRLLEQLSLFGKARFGLLHYLGYRGRRLLYGSYLRGQLLNYKGGYDKRGRRKVHYRIGKAGNWVAIKSYPLNLWERGFVTPKGTQVKGVHALRALKQDLGTSLLAAWAENYLNKLATKI